MAALLRLGLPKGSLQDSTLRLFQQAGFNFTTSSRSYHVGSDDPDIEALLIRSQEMARYVDHGSLDCGLTGLDWILETEAQVHEVAAFTYSKVSMRPVRWVLAVPESSPIQSVRDLQGKRIATEVVQLTRRYLEKHGVQAEVEFSWGATEIKAHQFVDAIVEVTETGNSLRANRLRIVDTLLESSTRLIANRDAWKDPAKREKIENIALLLEAAIRAQGKVGVKMNVPKAAQREIMDLLPSITSPTVSQLADSDWIAVEVILEESEIKRLIPALKRAGATGIIEYPLNKVVD
jgi:ATP phosphoribosyltransferase